MACCVFGYHFFSLFLFFALQVGMAGVNCELSANVGDGEE
jgi:hypothetical protein